MSGELVLVTGGSGFVGAHCVVRLLDEGYRVRATVRSAAREADVRAMVKEGRTQAGDASDVGGAGAGERAGAAEGAGAVGAGAVGAAESRSEGDLEVVVADLGADEGWAEAVAGCDYVLHVASPFPSGEPEHEDDLIVPAREGALRVLWAARDAGVRRVVLTSSFGAIGYGHPQSDEPFTEETWTDVTGDDVSAYVKSKTLAERAAWDFAEREGGGLELAVVNPVGVFGPVLGPDYSASVGLVQQLLDGGAAGVPRMHFAVVDVRDVADLHLLAMISPAAAGERFVAAAGETMAYQDIAVLLKERLGEDGGRVTTRKLPDQAVRMAAGSGSGSDSDSGSGSGSAAAEAAAANLGKIRHTSSAKARRLLGWSPRSNEETVLATARSLIRLGRR